MKSFSDKTLMGMKKHDLIDLIRCLENNVAAAEERNENQYRILVAKEKYAWHDLRKNPEDLPETHGMKLVKVDTYGWGTAYDCDVFVKGEFNFFSKYRDDVLAWREIDPFEP